MRLVKNIKNNYQNLFVIFLLFLSFLGNSFAITVDEENEIKSIVNQQLEAFQNDDFERAYSFASPTIKRMFSSPEVFRKMVIGGYQAVYRPQSIKMGSVEIIKGVTTLKVYLVDPNGEFVTANYLMEKQENGEWLISGCILSKAESDEI